MSWTIRRNVKIENFSEIVGKGRSTRIDETRVVSVFISEERRENISRKLASSRNILSIFLSGMKEELKKIVNKIKKGKR